MLAKNEQYVAQHQMFHDCCNSFVNWLRTAVEKLATCSDTYGEKSAIESKLEKAKVINYPLYHHALLFLHDSIVELNTLEPLIKAYPEKGPLFI